MSGPIAKKLIQEILSFSKKKIIDLKAIKEAQTQLEESIEKSRKDLSGGLDPLFAIYADIQHRIVDFFNLFSQLTHGSKFCDKYDQSEDIYMPSYPPMSPITNSFFTNWFTFDLGVGVKKETVASIMIDLYRQLKVPNEFIMLLKAMQTSYNGLYYHEGTDNEIIYLREIYTNTLNKVVSQTKHKGKPGEIWFIRLLPSPIPEYLDYNVAFSTPYIIMDIPPNKIGSKASVSCYKKDPWLEFFERNLFRIKTKTPEERYYKLMKQGHNKHYWLEYVFVSFVNFSSDMILLSGIPDKPETLAHHQDNSEIVC